MNDDGRTWIRMSYFCVGHNPGDWVRVSPQTAHKFIANGLAEMPDIGEGELCMGPPTQVVVNQCARCGHAITNYMPAHFTIMDDGSKRIDPVLCWACLSTLVHGLGAVILADKEHADGAQS